MSGVDHVVRHLWPGLDDGRVWAVLDGARANAVFDHIVACPRPARSLLAGGLTAALARAAPYLVSLRRDEPWTISLLGAAWGNAWGVALRHEGPNLHRHLCGALRLHREGGDRGIFRFYDPRVLRAYLDAADGASSAALFGPVRSFVVEGAHPDELVEYTRERGALSARRHVAERKLHWLGDYLRRG